MDNGGANRALGHHALGDDVVLGVQQKHNEVLNPPLRGKGACERPCTRDEKG